MRIFLTFIFAILAIPCAPAQETPLDSLASQMAKALSDSKLNSVLVFDFVGPGHTVNQLEQKLADDFSRALTKSDPKLVVGQGFITRKLLKDGDSTPYAPRDMKTVRKIASSSTTQAFITGRLSIKGDSVLLDVDSYRTDNGKLIKTLSVIMPLPQQTSTTTAENVDESYVAGLPEAGKNGYSTPTCLVCPAAQFSRAAIAAKAHGTVILEVGTGVDGRAHGIQSSKRFPTD